ncbi:terminase large subunit [Clostridium perfringens]|uniref:terminase TerL endonuclease subunit n=4 Tax=Clostridium perfringens TaxID=1502 RepID=UPI000D713DAA|nr:terminase TerL endonuclease subunit [Clostridium perfringens]EIF6153542.1 terminase [Clostridium perfringens]EJT6154944.1 terminase [Clostridium perfringens]ELC8353303.1 terminase [Clostridium perfringens]KAF2784489.1 terminase [Clostridium perfringens]MCX0382085.1 phage terminase family protein [Clostridium perfringens]
MNIRESKAYKYAYHCANSNDPKVGKYIRLQSKKWVDIVDGKANYAYIDEDKFNMICDLLKLMNFPDNPRITIYDSLIDYQWFFIVAILCTMDNKGNRLYETGLLEISRKNFKTYTSAIIFIISMLTEPKFSRFFSVAPDYKLSCELKVAVRKIIGVSPYMQKHFKVKRDMVECKLTDIEYVPLAYSNDGMDGKLANLFLADEAGAMDDYPVEAMRSSQITLFNKLGIIISTQYPNFNNVLTTEIDLAKKILEGLNNRKNYFALLYEPDNELIKEWQTNDLVIYQSNPAAVEIENIFNSIVEKRDTAILYESKRENYLCKHNNIMYKGVGVETYISSTQIQACKRVKEWDWKGKNVYIGVDAAETWDNSSISMIGYDEINDEVHSLTWCFVQEDRLDEKSKKENFNYKQAIEDGNCIICGEEVLDYNQFEQFVVDLPEKYGVNIVALGYDIRNLRNSAQRWERDYNINTVEVEQHSRTLHPTIKYLKELILQKKFAYYNNKIYESNFTNCRCTEDTNKNKYINKRKSTEVAGKVDMVFSTINALYLLQQDIENNVDYSSWGQLL